MKTSVNLKKKKCYSPLYIVICIYILEGGCERKEVGSAGDGEREGEV